VTVYVCELLSGVNGVCCTQLAAVNNCIEDWRIAMTGQMLAQIIAELSVCAVHPPPGTFYFSAAVVYLGFYDFMSLLVKFSRTICIFISQCFTGRV